LQKGAASFLNLMQAGFAGSKSKDIKIEQGQISNNLIP